MTKEEHLSTSVEFLDSIITDEVNEAIRNPFEENGKVISYVDNENSRNELRYEYLKRLAEIHGYELKKKD